MDLGFVWDDDKYQKVVADHAVRLYEVVSVFDDPNGYETNDPAGHSDRCLWIGQTVERRILAIVYSEEELPLYRLITAFEAEGRWLDAYHQRQRI